MSLDLQAEALVEYVKALKALLAKHHPEKSRGWEQYGFDDQTQTCGICGWQKEAEASHDPRP